MRSVWPPLAARPTSGIWVAELPRCSGYAGGDDAGGVPVQAGPRPVVAHGGARVGVGGSLLHVAQRDPSVEGGGDETVSQCGLTSLAIPARRVTRRTIRAAACRSSRLPYAVTKRGPSVRSPIARSIALAVRGARGMATTLPPLRAMTRVRCPRSGPRCSMSAPVASDTRTPFSASREISACSAGGPSPAATRRPPSSLRSSAVACDSYPAGDDGRAPRASGPGVLPRRRTCRTRRWCTAAA